MSYSGGAHHAGRGPSTMQAITGAYPTMALPVIEAAPTDLAGPQNGGELVRAARLVQAEVAAQRYKTARTLARVAITSIPEGVMMLGLGVAGMFIHR